MTSPILIWGTGAIGASLGAAFQRAGEAVHFVDTDAAHVAAMNDTGLTIDGPVHPEHLAVTAMLPADLRGTYDRIFLCVKALHTAGAVRSLAPHLAHDGYVVSAQNGLNEVEIAQVVGADRTVGCFVNFGADYLSPGVVHYSGRGAVVVGELDGTETARIRDLHALMLQFDDRAVLTDNIWGYLWGKMTYGALLFGTALTDDSIVDVLDGADCRAVLTALGQETGAVTASQGVTPVGFNGFDPEAFTPGAPQTALDRTFDEMVAHNRTSTKTHSGIWRDLAVRKRKTECEAQLGPIVATGRANGVPTPLTERLMAMIAQIERGERPLARGNLNELAEVMA
ncbi:ketopantoate reductase [Loktanella atrilutea]|uniref:2-dehydropantoate 2-reductase n=1 Tax=Loktanella atrilutea TaxID=366533 RepID=A0A1M4U535_LOKAT|nr:2-dehydropantoate 2-reductase [Loktanella atrilutea]SHE51773.1 ketopantoate reductase [Loktanella atrilutea]